MGTIDPPRFLPWLALTCFVAACAGNAQPDPALQPAPVATITVPAGEGSSANASPPARVEQPDAEPSASSAPELVHAPPLTTTRVASPSSADLMLARNLFRNGVQAFQEGRYADARTAFQDAYRIVPNASVLCNLAMVEMKMGNTTEACRYLSDWVHQASPTQERLQELVVELHQCGLSP